MPTLRDSFFNHLAQTSPFPPALEIVSASGVRLIDSSGRQYLDLISGISVSNLGHGNSFISERIKEQVDKHLHLLVYGELIEAPQVRLAEKLAELLPGNLSCTVFRQFRN
jgi:adenosylmethionine-8-amino-7-oxononanoate aminotransferase